LKKLKQPGQHDKLEANSKKLVEGIVAAAKEAGHAATGGYAGGMWGFFFCDGPVTCFADAEKADAAKFGRWHRAMLERGVYLAPSVFEAGFMSLAHTDEDIEKTLAIAKEVLATL
jgi:glutamate-1-semialdehyde 2,1-aminomutase